MPDRLHETIAAALDEILDSGQTWTVDLLAARVAERLEESGRLSYVTAKSPQYLWVNEPPAKDEPQRVLVIEVSDAS